MAQQVARALHYHFVDRDVMGLVFRQYGFAEFGDVYERAPGFMARFDNRRTEILKMLDQVFRALARHGNMVILGGGAFAILGGLADVLNVRIQASLPARVQWTMKNHDISDSAKAEALVNEGDKERAAFVEFSYRVRWDSVRSFDLVIDTGKLSQDLAVKWMTEAHAALLASKNLSTGPGSASAFEVDPNLSEAVSNALECQATH